VKETTKRDVDQRRLFFGMDVHAPWPENLPHARTLKAKHRHLTLAFLGNTAYSKIKASITRLPRPFFRVGPVGVFDACLFLPEHNPKVVSWHIESFGKGDVIAQYQENLISFLEGEGYELGHRKFLKHVTLGRSPFLPKQWKKSFYPLPLYFQNLHLYESHRGLCYEPIWTHDLLPPFQEIEHVADIAFLVFGKTLQQIYCNAQIALAFQAPQILPFLQPHSRAKSLEEAIINLNEALSQADHEIGMPFKAVSFHGEIEKKGEVLVWKMIVDI